MQAKHEDVFEIYASEKKASALTKARKSVEKEHNIRLTFTEEMLKQIVTEEIALYGRPFQAFDKKRLGFMRLMNLISEDMSPGCTVNQDNASKWITEAAEAVRESIKQEIQVKFILLFCF